MRKYMSIFDSSHEKLIEFINIYYTRRGCGLKLCLLLGDIF